MRDNQIARRAAPVWAPQNASTKVRTLVYYILSGNTVQYRTGNKTEMRVEYTTFFFNKYDSKLEEVFNNNR